MPRPRNAEVNEATAQAIKDTARRLMAEQGTAGLTLRGVARALEMSAPAIYHYFDSLDGLITALIADGFNALADALEAARDGEEGNATVKLLAVLLAYREWAVRHPTDFNLIYGSPIPGYEAPREMTVPAVIRGFSVIVGLIEEVLQRQQAVVPPPYDVIPPAFEEAARQMQEQDGYPVSAMALYLGIVGWGQLHGMIMLEVFGHLGPVVGDTETHYREQVVNMLWTFGVTI